MKKSTCLMLSILIFGVCLTSCKAENDSEKIACIVSEQYGLITPVDIYELKDGYINFWQSNKTIQLQKKYYFTALSYTKDKKNQLSNARHYLKYDTTAYKLTFWDTRDNQPADAFTYEQDLICYSEYYGEKEIVSFGTNVSFYKTMHIKLEEKSDTYKITYYGQEYSGFHGVSFSFNTLRTIEQYKNVIEVPKSDVSRIEYII